MGYDTKDEICGHGFRAMACSALMESGLWSQDAVERQMSHQDATAFERLTSIKQNISMPVKR
jgi:integrase